MPVLPRWNAYLERVEAEKAVAKVILEAGDHPDSNGRVYRRSADGHNRDRRRGLPLITRGVGGTMPGTDPLHALLQKEARSEWRR